MAVSDFGVVAESLRRSTVHVRGKDPRRGGGSGVIWRPNGLIITNAHVARGDHAVVELWDGSALDAAVTRSDPRRDLALLQAPGTGMPAAQAGESNLLRAGQLVVAVGNPLGFLGAVSTGVVHGLGPVRGLGRQNWVQADIRLAPGNSGGPLADAEGRVVGINTMVAAGLALAVPSDVIAAFLARTKARASLGVVVRPIPVEMDEARHLGLILLEVSPHSPAARASLLPGDVVIGVNNQPLRSIDDLHDALEQNELLSLRFLRGERRARREVTVRLASAEAA
jgi:serine protease Do